MGKETVEAEIVGFWLKRRKVGLDFGSVKVRTGPERGIGLETPVLCLVLGCVEANEKLVGSGISWWVVADNAHLILLKLCTLVALHLG